MLPTTTKKQTTQPISINLSQWLNFVCLTCALIFASSVVIRSSISEELPASADRSKFTAITAAAQRNLNKLAWTDKSKQFVQLPIETAKTIVVNRYQNSDDQHENLKAN